MSLSQIQQKSATLGTTAATIREGEGHTNREEEREREGKEGVTLKNVLTDALDSKTLEKIGLGHPLVQTNNRSIATYPGQIPLLHQGMQNFG